MRLIFLLKAPLQIFQSFFSPRKTSENSRVTLYLIFSFEKAHPITSDYHQASHTDRDIKIHRKQMTDRKMSTFDRKFFVRIVCNLTILKSIGFNNKCVSLNERHVCISISSGFYQRRLDARGKVHQIRNLVRSLGAARAFFCGSSTRRGHWK